jgi:serine/threonine-protein kinase RIM15
MIRPYVIREVTIDLPPVLVESLGVGAEMLARYLTQLAEAGINDPANHPPPLPVLCRICERQITPWWFEKHTDLCLQEHQAEMEVQLAHEALSDHRSAIVKVLDSLDAQSRQPRATSGETSTAILSPPEYKGLPIGPSSNPSSGPSSGRASPASPSRSRDRSSQSFGHNRARSFAVRRPVARIVELVLDLCDTALEINTPAVRNQQDGEFRTQSPQSENRTSQVTQWQSPGTNMMEQEHGLSLLSDDTSKFARAKVDAIFRHRRILEYSERIRVEFDCLVQECIEAALVKAARIAAGESDSSDTENERELEEAELHERLLESEIEQSNDERPAEEGIFPGSFENHSAMSLALRTAELSLGRVDRRTSSTAASTRSNSPRGSQTPRSHAGTTSLPPPSKRGSIYFESDAGADSDSSMVSSAMSIPRRAESPSSELSLARVHSSRERKRRSLILPSVMSSRGQSPARSIPPVPSSPLRMVKQRIPSGQESSHSPITSPVLSTSDFSSPSILPQYLQTAHHRRQSSAASSEVFRPQLSPRLAPTSNVSSNPQPRAVPPSIKDFEIIKPISKGAFGSVYLSKKKSTGDYFAIKVLKKADMVAKNQVTNVKAERAIMMWQGESEFVAKLYWTFSSKDYLYLVMEYLNGGDCAALIKTLGGLPENWSKKYMAEVVLGVDHLHSRGIVHRDLKPDNLLIDQKGHLKLTDFGLSRMGLVGRQKRALNRKSDEAPVPDLLKQGPFHRAISVGSSRSASFDMHGNHSPSQTPSMTPAVTGDMGQPSYFSLSREPSRRVSGSKTDSENSEVLQAMLRKFSLIDDSPLNLNQNHPATQSPIEEETGSGESNSPDPYALQPIPSIGQSNTPPASMLPPAMALFDPQDTSRKFVGTPDYLAPETINGVGQDEVSDWWSLGCILFEFIYGFPPFHGDTPEEVFQNILARRIHWPDEEDYEVSEEAKDLMNKLMCLDPAQRLGSNVEEKFESGGAEIRNHPWFSDVDWDSLRETEASFIPALQDVEDTEYFDARGATMQNFSTEFDDQGTSPAGTPGADYPERPHDALSRVRSQVNSMKRGLMPLHIPPHVRDGRSRRLSEPVAADDFGNFAFKNLPVLEKANKDVIQKLRAEAMHAQSKSGSMSASPAVMSPSPSLESSPILAMPLKRTMSAAKNTNRPSSPLLFTQPSASPSRISQPSSPLLVQFSAGQSSERRKASSGASSLSHQSSGSLQPGSFLDGPRMMANLKATSTASSPIKLSKSPSASAITHERSMSVSRQNGNCTNLTSPRARSRTVSSQESEDVIKELNIPSHHKRRSQALDMSPSSSDNEDTRVKAFLKVQRRRQSSRRMSQHLGLLDVPVFRPLDVLVCEDHPVSRLVMEKLLEKLRCCTVTAQDGPAALKYAMGEVKFDIILMEYKLPQLNGADVARMIRDTKNVNSQTPIVCVTGYLKELPPSHHFDGLIEKPPTTSKLTEILGRLCQWKPPPANWTGEKYSPLPGSNLRHEPGRDDESPATSISSGTFGGSIPSGGYRSSTGTGSITSIDSSWFKDNERVDDVSVATKHISSMEDWPDHNLRVAFSGLGISEGPLYEADTKITIPSLTHQMSAPGSLEHPPPRKKLSAERIDGKRKSMEKKRKDSADSGDDEDEELGHVQIRGKSPRAPGRARGSSKLGTEMMRTNSRGSVVSVDDISHSTDVLPSSPPPAISEEGPGYHDMSPNTHGKISLTPPEMFPRLPGAAIEDIEMDAATPKAPTSNPMDEADPDPTPRPSISGEKGATPADGSPSPSKK